MEINDYNSSMFLKGDEEDKNIRSFIEDKNFQELDSNLKIIFSKHIILSFFENYDLKLALNMFENYMNYFIATHKVSAEDMYRINALRLAFFGFVKRAIGRRNKENERELLGKHITENVVSEVKK